MSGTSGTQGDPSRTSKITLAKALNAGLRRALEADPKVLLAGEDIGKLGGVFRVTEGLQKDFGEHRVIDSPLAESGIVGTAVGLALRGYRPVCEIQFDGFVYPAFDQIVSQVAKFHNRSAGRTKMPIVIRIPSGGGIGAVEHHSESPETYFAHTPGLKVVTCANPVDAYWMIQQAVASDDPVIFFEPKRRYHEKAELDTSIPPIPLHSARVVRPGDDVTVLCYGSMRKTCPGRRRGCRGGSAVAAGDRPADPLADRHGHRRHLGAQVVPRRDGAEAVINLGPGCRLLRGSDHRAVLLCWRRLSCGAEGCDRSRSPPPVGSRTSTSRTWTGCSTRSTGPWRTEPGY